MKARVLDTQRVTGGSTLDNQSAVLLVGYVPDGLRLVWVQQESRIVSVSYERRVVYA